MSDFVNGIWSWYVAALTLVAIVACVILLRSQSTKRVSHGKQAQLHGHVWDGDLAEYNNPLPRWWMWLFYLTIAFSLGYLVFYPGLGNLPGILGWSSAGAYVSEVRESDERTGPLYAKYMAMDVKQVATDDQAHAMGERLFLTYCAQCHGSDAGGGKGFPDLRDADWLYGGDPETIKQSISNGRNGIMPAWG